MRLIDADELTVLFEDLINHYTEDLERHKDIPQRYKGRIEGQIDGVVACGMDLYTMPTVKAIPIEQLLSILPKYDDYIHTRTYYHNVTMEDIYFRGHEDGWKACLKAIKEELDEWEKENAE